MQRILKVKKDQLRVSHQSEVITLRHQIKDLQQKLDQLTNQMVRIPGSPARRKLLVPASGGHQYISFDTIRYCEAQGGYTRIHLLEGHSLLVAKTLKCVEADIADHDFIRCHQSFLVNREYVCGYGKKGLQLVDQKWIPISRRKKDMVLSRLS